VGAGDGAIELAFAADRRWQCVSVENAWNDTFRHLRNAIGAPMRRVIADAAHLPFRNECFAAITCLETVEHLHEPTLVSEELARVTARTGVLLITTPPRLRYALRPDPHFNIRGLLLLPMRMQRRIATRRGYTRPDHYVNKIYTSTRQLCALFRAFTVQDILGRSRAPRQWFWDAIILRKQS
jgi:SAM-dependent methyltransferase